MASKQEKSAMNLILYKVSGDLSPLPITVTEIMKMSQKGDFSAMDLAKVIERDQAMASKILRISNSAYYGFVQKIKTIDHAIVCLGIESVKSLAFTIGSENFLQKELGNYGLERGALFKHSIAAAVVGKMIATKTDACDPDEAYMMGLLHDIGKLMIDQYASEEFAEVTQLYNRGEVKFYRAEKEILGYDHAQLGAEVGRRWNFPDALCRAIECHHSPIKAGGDSRSVYVIHFANGIVNTMDIGSATVSKANLKRELGGVFELSNLSKIGLKQNQIMDIRNASIPKIKELFSELRL
jgi:putative nucleotidyltransferase with HDIG domain